MLGSARPCIAQRKRVRLSRLHQNTVDRMTEKAF